MRIKYATMEDLAAVAAVAAKGVPVAVAAMVAAVGALLCRGRRAVRDSCLVSYCRIYYP